jgi:urease accessory protein
VSRKRLGRAQSATCTTIGRRSLVWHQRVAEDREAGDEAGAVDLRHDLCTASPVVDWCSMRHETQYTRLFRS